MRLGIDLGTTRTVVAFEDRGNFPVVGFSTPDGDLIEHYPTVSADVGGVLTHGHEAEAAARDGAPILRSWKRLLSGGCGDEPVTIGSITLPLIALAADFLCALRREILARSNLPDAPGPETGAWLDLESVVSVPANAHSTQRFLTLEAFRRAGFNVLALLDEPSAAGLEYAHRHARTITSRRGHVVVYDLGGGTFDAALVHLGSGGHEVVTTSGISRLGGDDFDEALLALALGAAGVERGLSAGERTALLLECRLAKESLHPSSRRISLELAALGDDAPPSPATVSVADFYESVRPLVARTIEALDPVLAAEPGDADDAAPAALEAELAGLYVVGGASGLPIVPRMLRERFGRRVHRTPHGSGATAIGLAIAAASPAERPTERLSRHFGVFREREAGRAVSFDGIFEKGTRMPRPGEDPLRTTRSYRAAHDLGHFRFVECGEIDGEGDPRGDITWHAEVRFPFAAALQAERDLESLAARRLDGPGPLVEERYDLDPAGVVTVTITDATSGFARAFRL